jgi:hypothetical protein
MIEFIAQIQSNLLPICSFGLLGLLVVGLIVEMAKGARNKE